MTDPTTIRRDLDKIVPVSSITFKVVGLLSQLSYFNFRSQGEVSDHGRHFSPRSG
jgi:hypothetical protein